jgi:hypothetical protein
MSPGFVSIASVAAQPFYSPTWKPPAAKPRTPNERLWELQKAHITWSAELRFHGESWGWEAQIYRNGEITIGRRFDTDANKSAPRSPKSRTRCEGVYEMAPRQRRDVVVCADAVRRYLPAAFCSALARR